MLYFVELLDKGDLYIRVLAPLLGEDLDPNEVVFVTLEAVIVPVDLAVKDDRECSGSQRLARHFQFFRGNGREAVAREERGRASSNQNQEY
jgi:Fe-S-cluster formation regulator IscX/YfhJ